MITKAQNKKALSAATPKASHLTVISSAGNRPMNNSTAVKQNNQDTWAIVDEVKRVSNVVAESAHALRAIKEVLAFNSCNKKNGEDTLSEYAINGLLATIGLIGNTLDDGANDLIGTLTEEGF